MATSFEAWKKKSANTPSAVWALIRDRVKQGLMTQKELAGALGVSTATISRHVRDAHALERLSPAKLERIRQFLYQHELRRPAGDLSLAFEYLGFASFFGQTDNDKAAIIVNSQGFYRVWRWSNWNRGSILEGSLSIWFDEAKAIVCTHESYSASRGDSHVFWPRSGFLISRGQNELALVSKKDDAPQVQIAYLRTPTPSRRSASPQEYATIDGMVFDMQEHKIYSSPILIERVGTAAYNAPVRDFTPADPKFAVLAKRLSDLNATFSDQIYSLG